MLRLFRPGLDRLGTRAVGHPFAALDKAVAAGGDGVEQDVAFHRSIADAAQPLSVWFNGWLSATRSARCSAPVERFVSLSFWAKLYDDLIDWKV